MSKLEVRKMKYVHLFILLVAILWSCRHGEGERQSLPEAPLQADTVWDSTALRVVVMPTLDCLPMYVAEECGLFDSLGVDNSFTGTYTTGVGGYLDFLERVPLSAGGAFAYPLGRFLPAIAAYVCFLVFCHNSTKVAIIFVNRKLFSNFAACKRLISHNDS